MFSTKYSQNTYYIETFGCTFNFGDSKKIESVLSSYNFEPQPITEANLIIINTCAVKHTTEVKILFHIQKLKNNFPTKLFVITGCLPFIGKKKYLEIQNMLSIDDIILKPDEIHLLGEKLGYSPLTSQLRKKSKIFSRISETDSFGIIQLSEGCNNNCSYCCTTISRGKLISFPSQDILEQIKHFLINDVNEIYLSSQDLGNYNFNGEKLHHLLHKISKIKGNFQIRLGMLNPEYLSENFADFLPIFKDKRFYRFLHIPIQSGSNFILKKMNRNYTIEDVKRIILKILHFDSKFNFATDVIVGFPGETDTDFDQTLEILNWWKPSVLNISKYSVRDNTLAKKMKQLDSQTIKNRSTSLHLFYANYSHEIRKSWINWEGSIKIVKYDKNSNFSFFTRNLYYLPVLVKGELLSYLLKIKIEKIEGNSLIGIPLPN